MSASSLPGTDKSDVDVTEDTTDARSFHMLGSGRGEIHIRDNRNSYQLIINVSRNNTSAN